MLLIKRGRLVRLSIIFDSNNNKYYLGNVFVKRNRSVYYNIESMISEYRVTYCKIINVFTMSEYLVSTTPIWQRRPTRNVGAYKQAQTDDSEAQVYCKYSILSRRSTAYCLHFSVTLKTPIRAKKRSLFTNL